MYNTQFFQNSRLIKQYSQELGFDYCGIAKAERLEDDARRLEAWLNKGYQGKMQYMENHFDLRIDPRKLVPGAKSVITLLCNYYPEEQQENSQVKIAKYAYGKDYHEVIRAKLHKLLQFMQDKIGEVTGRGFVDSAPVLERAWAQKTGLGWIGKNANLINKKNGSYFFIATLIVDLELTYDDPMVKDYCGTCTKCIDACPTQAILTPQTIDATKCISYLTIELKDEILPQQFSDKMSGWMFGCDICQEVCPWNRFAAPHQEQEFKPVPELLSFSAQDWKELDEITFKNIFRHSPLKRTKWKGIQRNLKMLYPSDFPE